MSASNWALCPSCVAAAREQHLEDANAVAALYGKVSICEFDAARDRLQAVNIEDYRTFREDYEIYTTLKGMLCIDYSGGCAVCGLEHHFKHAKQFWSASEVAPN